MCAWSNHPRHERASGATRRYGAGSRSRGGARPLSASLLHVWLDLPSTLDSPSANPCDCHRRCLGMSAELSWSPLWNTGATEAKCPLSFWTELTSWTGYLYAGDVGGEEVDAVAVEVAAGPVVVLGGPGVSMPSEDLGVAEGYAGVEGVGDGGMP